MVGFFEPMHKVSVWRGITPRGPLMSEGRFLSSLLMLCTYCPTSLSLPPLPRVRVEAGVPDRERDLCECRRLSTLKLELLPQPFAIRRRGYKRHTFVF